MNFDVLFSSAAQDDLDGIFAYISVTLAAPMAAKDLSNSIHDALDTLIRDLSRFSSIKGKSVPSEEFLIIPKSVPLSLTTRVLPLFIFRSFRLQA